EYAAGLHDYQLGFPKGLIDPGETPEEAAQRELKEEVGYGSHQLEFLMELSLAPQFFSAKMSVFVARDLYPESLPGDEPEPLEKVTWSISDINNLFAQPDFSEARSVAALLMLLRNQGEGR
ncbi:MAG: ADP compounds hydrolase NudE, partial [Idiomarina sp.]|nr:ADP compounds hydrolase NudE [Idiomarina sp.]